MDVLSHQSRNTPGSCIVMILNSLLNSYYLAVSAGRRTARNSTLLYLHWNLQNDNTSRALQITGAAILRNGIM